MDIDAPLEVLCVSVEAHDRSFAVESFVGTVGSLKLPATALKFHDVSCKEKVSVSPLLIEIGVEASASVTVLLSARSVAGRTTKQSDKRRGISFNFIGM